MPCTCGTGSLLGLASALPAMCRHSNTDVKAHLAATHERLSEYLTSLEPADSAYDVSGIGFVSCQRFTVVNCACTRQCQLYIYLCNVIFQATCLCLSNLATCGYAYNILPQTTVDASVASLYQAHMQNTQVCLASIVR